MGKSTTNADFPNCLDVLSFVQRRLFGEQTNNVKLNRTNKRTLFGRARVCLIVGSVLQFQIEKGHAAMWQRAPVGPDRLGPMRSLTRPAERQRRPSDTGNIYGRCEAMKNPAFGGPGRAAKQRGDSAAAHDAYGKLMALSKPVGPARPELDEAKSYLTN
jgi:hypothetical protein